MPDWLHDFFDLTANKKVELKIRGEVGFMAGILLDVTVMPPRGLAYTDDQYSLDEVMEELMKQVKENS